MDFYKETLIKKHLYYHYIPFNQYSDTKGGSRTFRKREARFMHGARY